ncbi:MAG: hypothetical protein ACTSPV_14495 [Candidatus Hodarchaeales archaeon]
MSEITEMESPPWLFMHNLRATENKLKLEEEKVKPNHGTLGKYLFFSDDKSLLISLGKEILLKYNLYSAKVPSSDKPRPNKGFGFVLCIYDCFPRFKRELRDYADGKTIHYRYWKSNTATLQGKYSKEFKSSLKSE